VKDLWDTPRLDWIIFSRLYGLPRRRADISPAEVRFYRMAFWAGFLAAFSLTAPTRIRRLMDEQREVMAREFKEQAARAFLAELRVDCPDVPWPHVRAVFCTVWEYTPEEADMLADGGW
jgi:hypothetical protein